MGKSGSFVVKHDAPQTREWVNGRDVFSSIEPARTEALSPGDIVYYNKMYWAMVIGKRNDKIVIRQEGFPATDIAVHVSKLQIL